MLKFEENPPIVWPESKNVTEISGQWWVAHTKARMEKALAQQLVKKDIAYFLPLREKVSKKSRRVFRSMLPLFSGYLFFCGDEDDRVEVLKTNRVANIIPVTDQQKLIDELYPIEIALRNGLDLQPCELAQPGQKCKIIAGPLMGTEGIVLKVQNEMKLVLQVEMLGQASCLEIQSDMIDTL